MNLGEIPTYVNQIESILGEIPTYVKLNGIELNLGAIPACVKLNWIEFKGYSDFRKIQRELNAAERNHYVSQGMAVSECKAASNSYVKFMVFPWIWPIRSKHVANNRWKRTNKGVITHPL